jgi:hypothetical protein
MRRLALPFLMAAALAAWSLASRPAPAPSSCKPSSPIDLEAKLVGDPYAPFGIVASASSRTGHEVELEVVLPDGVVHLGGDRRATGKRCGLRVDVQATGRERREIFVRATIRDGNARLTRVIPLVVNDAPAEPKGSLKTNARGEAILEFRP